MIKEAKEITELAKKNAELAKKREAAERKMDRERKMVDARLRAGEPLGTKDIDYKYSVKNFERAVNNQEKTQSKLKSKSKG